MRLAARRTVAVADVEAERVVEIERESAPAAVVDAERLRETRRDRLAVAAVAALRTAVNVCAPVPMDLLTVAAIEALAARVAPI